MTIHKRMAAILADCSAIEKSRTNTHQNFKFRGIDDAMNALHGVFAKHEVFILPCVNAHSVTEKPTAKGGTTFVHYVDVIFSFVASDGTSIQSQVKGEAADTGDKGLGKALSYALKLCLLQTFLIPTEEEKDPDYRSHDIAAKPPVKAAAPVAAPKESNDQFEYAKHRELVVVLAKEMNISNDFIKAHKDELVGKLETFAYANKESVRNVLALFKMEKEPK